MPPPPFQPLRRWYARSMHSDQTRAESPEAPDTDGPEEGQDAGDEPRTEPGNPGVDPERVEKTEEDLERAGGN